MSHIPQRVVESIFNSSTKVLDSEVNEMAEALGKLCEALNVDASESQTGFHLPVAKHTFDVLRLEQMKKIAKQQEEKSEEIRKECQQLEEACEKLVEKQEKTKNKKSEIRNKCGMLEASFQKNRKELKEIENKLAKVGYNASLSDEAMKKLEDEVEQSKQELKKVTDELALYEGVDPDEESMKRAILELREELAYLKDSSNGSM